MGIINKMFKWFTAKDKDGKEMNLGYVLDGEPKTIQDIEKVFNAFQLDKYFDAIKLLLRPKIELTLVPTDELIFDKAKSKIGGQPHLPADFEWPKNEIGKSLSFIGQLNLEEVSNFDTSKLLPTKGLLLFFYCADQEAWGYSLEHKQRFKVLYFEDINSLIKIKFPKDLETHSIYTPNKITFTSCLCIPPIEYVPDDLILDDDTDNYSEASFGSDNQIFGYANCVQNQMEFQCQTIVSKINTDSEEGLEQLLIETRKSEWILLLQIDSEDDKTGMMWGDCGRIYFWIKKQDLVNKKFENTWCILQCY